MLRAAAIQMRSGVSRSGNVAAAERLIREAAGAGATLIVTPEMTNVLDRDKERLFGDLPQEDGLSEITTFAEFSKELGMYLVIGSLAVALPDEDGQRKMANRCMMFGPNGEIARYDKIHLFDVDLPTGESWRESRMMKRGEEAVLARTDAASVGLSICYDVRFPHLYRALAKAGAEILTIPAAFTVPTGEAHWEVLLRARAIETGSFVIAAAQGGAHEDGRRTYGHSMIIDPWGRILTEKSDDEPGVIMADLDLDLVRDARTRIPSLALDRDTNVRTLEA
ncbi:carbon-nitrogen hydrolase family protein [Parvularcula marina]|uniref:Carbon-nitrogen hydrolase family protein n=1 Tax=Parvularcula marina TaxID=2292771 RepID=A0A371RKW8_9PROT|nr:carbon-nitrogen hydrolase family protein [Parvularcula marina]RFB06110.1 carbon-nitrogen hydrolase family protein [Parvularcula marina]